MVKKSISLTMVKFTLHKVYPISVRNSVGGVKASIVASQAIDPGSIPGQRNFFTDFWSVLAMKALSNFICLHAFVWSLKEAKSQYAQT